MFRDHHTYPQVRQKVEAVLAGSEEAEHVTGSTSVRAAVGLVIGRLDALTTMSEASAWSYLDEWQREAVHELRSLYAERIARYYDAGTRKS